MSKNLHLLYYKKYFSGINWKNKEAEKVKIKNRNKVLTGTGLLPKTNEMPGGGKPHLDTLLCEVLYPGLVTGIGIDHEAQIEGEFKLGLHFDWTLGMPVVYGSSVKGVLRSYFKDIYNPNDAMPSEDDAFNAIFEGKGKSIYDRDIFFDAVIVKADKKDRILCPDSITSHGDNPLKNPNPITFLKIAPGCRIEFRFKLVDTRIVKEGKELVLSKKQKLEIFEAILTTVGIGAKTNVGYGQLKKVK